LLPKIVIAAANRKAGRYICRRFSPARHCGGQTGQIERKGAPAQSCVACRARSLTSLLRSWWYT